MKFVRIILLSLALLMGLNGCSSELEILGALTLVTLPFATADYGPKEANKDSTAIEDDSKDSAQAVTVTDTTATPQESSNLAIKVISVSLGVIIMALPVAMLLCISGIPGLGG
ncbi:MAG: hypothetical protein MJY93_01475 [Fibrobacter sp.]|nr:hypothetical protein [Fibrobacter sp.]